MLALVHRLRERVGLHIRSPRFELWNPCQHVRNLAAGQLGRWGELVLGEREVGFGACSARRCDAAELAPRAGTELAPARRSQLGLRLHLGLSPCEEVGDAGFPSVNVAPPGLVDRHRNIGDVIQVPESVDGSERVQHELRVVCGLDEDALPVLEIDDLQLGFGDDHAVAGTETARHDVGEVEALLDQHLRITTGLPCQ